MASLSRSRNHKEERFGVIVGGNDLSRRSFITAGIQVGMACFGPLFLPGCSNDGNDVSIAFIGDSVTYCMSDDTGNQLENPWPQQVGDLLHANVSNLGISSASLMPGIMGDGQDTPCAWVDACMSLDDAYDIVGVMIGINDCFRDYKIGSFDDDGSDTFYGSLHILWQRLLKKYPPEANKRLFTIVYPHYEGTNVSGNYTWDSYSDAIIDVASNYAIPILDMREELGISCFADSEGKYWRQWSNGHSPHLTQLGADVFAPVVANFIESHFLLS